MGKTGLQEGQQNDGHPPVQKPWDEEVLERKDWIIKEHFPEGSRAVGFFFLMWTIFKVFIEFVTILLPFCVLGFCH